MQHALLLMLCFLIYGMQPQAQNLHHRDKPLPCLNKTFSIYAHLVKNEAGNVTTNREQIESLLVEVNASFAPICVKFQLCQLDTIENYNYADFDYEDGTSDEMINRNYVSRRINFYFVHEIREECGFADLGGVANIGRAYVVLACLSSGVISHELGHLFGLTHTFEGNREELVNGSNCATTGDGLCDTPADPYHDPDDISDYVTQDCEFISLLRDANGEFYQPDVGNIMSYYCRCGFSYDQYLRMAETYLNSNPKVW